MYTRSVVKERLSRPHWPYGRWNYTPATVGEHKNNDLQKHAVLKPVKEDRANGLQTFLRVFDKDLQVFETERGKAVEGEINGIMETILKKINGMDGFFKQSCRIIKTGSVAEGTKIRELNEFDFLLVLDIFKIKDFVFYPDTITFTTLEVKEDAKQIKRCCNICHDEISRNIDTIAFEAYSLNVKSIEECTGKRRSMQSDYGDYNISGVKRRKRETCMYQIADSRSRSNEPLDEQAKLKLDNYEIEHLRLVFIDLFLQKLREILNTSDDFNHWEARDCTSSIATTIHLRSDRYDMDVDIDICFCIPVKETDMDNIVSTRGADMNEIGNSEDNKRYLDFIKSALHSDPELEVFAIIGQVNKTKQRVLTRLCIHSFELNPFLECGRQSGQVKTYRLAKCIVEYLFPKGYEKNSYNHYLDPDSFCIRCDSQCLVKSYHLKNIILYMINNHRDPSLWSEENIPHRVIEVFDILLKCSQDYAENESCAGYIATFSIPGSLLLQQFYNHDPVAPFRDRKKPILFTGDKHKCTLYEPCFWPEYSKTLRTNNTSINSAVKSYFQCIKNENWSSSDLILKINDLLYNLKTI